MRFVSCIERVHRIPLPTFRDDREAPLCGTGWRDHTPIFISEKENYFRPRGLTRFLKIRSSGKSARMIKEKPRHLLRCVRSSRIGIGARRAASGPGVTASMNAPVFKDCAPARVDVDCAGVGMSSGYSPPMHLRLRPLGFHGLRKNPIRVAWMYGGVAIAVKNDCRYNWPVI